MLVSWRFGDVPVSMCLVRIPSVTSEILVVGGGQTLFVRIIQIQCYLTYSFQPVLGIEGAFDLAVEIRKYLFSECLDRVDALFLA